MKKRAGLAILTIASIYQVNKMRKQKKERETLIKARNINNPTRRTPVQIIKEAERIQDNEIETVEYTDENSGLELTQKFTRENRPTIVYIVDKGTKYHLTKDCRGIKGDSNLIEISLDEANKKGYSLCGWERDDK